MMIITRLRSFDTKKVVNRIFCIVNGSLSLLCGVMLLFSLEQACVILFYLYYIMFFTLQAITHYLCFKIPKMNVQIYDKLIRRIIGLLGIVETSYLFAAILFWSRSPIHVGYCALCMYYGLPISIGIAIDIHCFLTILGFANLLHSFVTRRYYLLALGGYEVQQRRLQQIQEINNRQPMLQPNYNDYPFPQNNQLPKYCKFQDIDDSIEMPQSFICSICLNAKLPIIKQEQQQEKNNQKDCPVQIFEKQIQAKTKSTKSQNSIELRETQNTKAFAQKKQFTQDGQQIVYTPCKHFFHKNCIQNWAKVNPNCPDCRFKLLISTD